MDYRASSGEAITSQCRKNAKAKNTLNHHLSVHRNSLHSKTNPDFKSAEVKFYRHIRLTGNLLDKRCNLMRTLSPELDTKSPVD